MSGLTAVKLKNYNVAVKGFVLFLTFAFGLGCSPKNHVVSEIRGSEIAVTPSNGEDARIAAFIEPYKAHIEADMNTVLAVAPSTIEKSGTWQSPMGSLFADVTLSQCRPLFAQRNGKQLDFCMLNAGGVRSIIPAGNVTMKTAYEIMPFENSCIVVEMRHEQMMEMIGYLIADKKPHPLSGLNFTIGKDGNAHGITVGGLPYDAHKTYYCVTNDYLYMGGDNMTFFARSGVAYPLDYKLRNVLIDYFKKNDRIVAPTDVRIATE